MKHLLQVFLIAGIINVVYAVHLQSAHKNQDLDDNFKSSLPLDGPNEFRNQAALPSFRKAEIAPISNSDSLDADKNTKEIESFDMLERDPDGEEELYKDKEEEDLGESAEIKQTVEDKSYFNDQSSDFEVDPERVVDRLPNILIGEEHVGSNPYLFANEAHQPSIDEEPSTRFNEASTGPQNQTFSYSVPHFVQSPDAPLENYEFSRQAEKDNSELTEERGSYRNPAVEGGFNDPRQTSKNDGSPRWEEENGFDNFGPEIEKFVDTSSPIQRSQPNWPTRDMNRLGVQPSHSACRQPLDMGVGPEELPSWYYSYVQGRCHWFAYRGHGGNANRFSSRDACESLCVFEKVNLCSNVRCSYRNSRCTLRGDEECRSWVRRNGGDVDSECPPDQPVCQDRRAIMAPEIDNRLVPSDCFEEYNPGNCLVKTPVIRFYYDPDTNSCLGFYFHKCGGNNNRFLSKEDCMNHCSV